MNKLDHVKMLSETDIDGAIVWAENNIDSVREFFLTWSQHCGAPKEVFKGHAIRMLIDIDNP